MWIRPAIAPTAAATTPALGSGSTLMPPPPASAAPGGSSATATSPSAGRLVRSPSRSAASARASSFAAEVEFRRRGHRHYDERHPNRWTPGGAGLTEPPEGFADWSAYVAARVDRLGRPQATRIAAELGITRWMAQRLVADVRAEPRYYLRRGAPRT